MMTNRTLLIFMSLLVLSGCSTGSAISTSSLFGGSGSTSAIPQASPQNMNDPGSRAFQVGSVAARAVKCGYNFDPVKLRTSYLASESTLVSPEELGRIEKIYDTAFNGVAKGIADQANYCTEQKTAEIKASLTRHLAGDYSPTPIKLAQPEPGFFSEFFDSSAANKGPQFGSDNWWEKQKKAVGQ
ncbi:MAG: hypothetical protein ACKOW3_04430 [Hyphomicrobium sp.]